MYRVTEQSRDGSRRTVLECNSRETCARFFCALLGRDTLTVLQTRKPEPSCFALGEASRRADFVQRDALRVVTHALNARFGSASFCADGANGKRYTAEFVPPAPSRPHALPPGYYDLTRLTRSPSDGRAAVPSEQARAW